MRRAGVAALFALLTALAGFAVSSALDDEAPGEAPALERRVVLPQLASGESPLALELAAARTRWAAAGITDYRLTGLRAYFGGVFHITIEVHGDTVTPVSVECDGWTDTCANAPIEELAVPHLFSVVDAALARQLDVPPGQQGALTVEATFDAIDGHPLSVYTSAFLITDTASTWTVDSFAPLPAE